jgi:hypothetical protein
MGQPEGAAKRFLTLTVPVWTIDAATSSAPSLLLERPMHRCCDLVEVMTEDGIQEWDGPAMRTTRRIREIRSFILRINKNETGEELVFCVVSSWWCGFVDLEVRSDMGQ